MHHLEQRTGNEGDTEGEFHVGGARVSRCDGRVRRIAHTGTYAQCRPLLIYYTDHGMSPTSAAATSLHYCFTTRLRVGFLIPSTCSAER